jgi:hypothetical protein
LEGPGYHSNPTALLRVIYERKGNERNGEDADDAARFGADSGDADDRRDEASQLNDAYEYV